MSDYTYKYLEHNTGPMIDFTGIDFLSVLQNLRESLPDFISVFFAFMSSPVFYIGLPFTIALIFFWCVDKKGASFLAINCLLSTIVGGLLKDLIKQPRPWNISPDIHPYGPALEDSGGYSFPSAHVLDSTATAASLWHMLGKHPLTYIVTVIALIIFFARMFLGVHTPLDVISSVLIALIIVLMNMKIIDWAFRDDKHFNIVFIGYLVVFIILYIAWMSCGDSGAYEKYNGIIIGAILGLIIERNFIRYEIEKLPLRKNILKCIIGFVIAVAVFIIPYVIIQGNMGMAVGGFLLTFVSFTLTPILFRKLSVLHA